jgi:hypothetical protein
MTMPDLRMNPPKELIAKTTKPKQQRSYSINDIIAWKFQRPTLPQVWIDHVGNIDDRFTMYIDGEPGNGKTEYVIQLAKMLCNYIGKTRLNNVEQGKHSQIRDSIMRNDFKNAIAPGKFQYDSVRDYDAFVAKLKRPNSGRNIIIDSISYWPLNAEQIQHLMKTFKNKNFVLVGYKAHFTKNQPIIHLCDIKVRVENFIASNNPAGRFGGQKNYNIWPERFANRASQTPMLFDTPIPSSQEVI